MKSALMPLTRKRKSSMEFIEERMVWGSSEYRDMLGLSYVLHGMSTTKSICIFIAVNS